MAMKTPLRPHLPRKAKGSFSFKIVNKTHQEELEIPVFKQIQEFPHKGPPYMRPCENYIHYNEGEVPFSITRILYDMDSDDEEWLNQSKNKEVNVEVTSSQPLAPIHEDTFERIIDKLERASFFKKQDPISMEDALDVCQEFRSQEEIQNIYVYWCEKRKKKGMALVRHFQPPRWNQSQKQWKDWHAIKKSLRPPEPPFVPFSCIIQRGCQKKKGFGSSFSRVGTVPDPKSVGGDDDKVAIALAARRLANAKRKVAITGSSREMAFRAIAFALTVKEIKAIADAIQAAERDNQEVAERSNLLS